MRRRQTERRFVPLGEGLELYYIQQKQYTYYINTDTCLLISRRSVYVACAFTDVGAFINVFIYYLQSVLCLVFPMLAVSLDCPFLIAPLIFSILRPVSWAIKNGQSRDTTNIGNTRHGTKVRKNQRGLTFVLCLVFSMLAVSLDCPFLIAPLVGVTPGDLEGKQFLIQICHM
jgi:hypothetical protein